MDKARVAVFEGDEEHRKMIKASFDRLPAHLSHKIVVEVISKQEALDALDAMKRKNNPVDVIVLGENLASHDKGHRAAKQIIKHMHDLRLTPVVIGISDQGMREDHPEAAEILDYSQIWDLPNLIKSIPAPKREAS